MDNGCNQFALLGRVRTAWYFDDGSSGQVNLDSLLDSGWKIHGIEVHGDKGGSVWKLTGSELSTPLINPNYSPRAFEDAF